MSERGPVASLPWGSYTDPAALRLEEERVFRRSWQYAARADQVAEPGSYVATSAGGLPVVVVRDRERVLRAFVNVCRHRGSIVCEGEGQRETLQCPYHAWTYDLDGSLRVAPRADREHGFDRAALGLLPVAVDAWGPFVFVNPDVDAAPLRDWLGGVPGLLARDGVDVESLVFRRRDESELEANWKICVENYLECYHCPTAHRGFSRVIDVAEDRYQLEVGPQRASQFCSPSRNGGAFAGGPVAGGQFHLLFPNTVVNVMPGAPNLSIGPIVPVSPERTSRWLDYFFAADADEQWVAEFLELDEQVGAEDRALVERVHRGVRTGAIGEGVLLAESEQLVVHFDHLLREALARS